MMTSLDLRAGQRLPVRGALALTAQVTPAAFAASANVHTVIHPPARTAINQPRFLNADAGGPKPLGPFFLLPDIGRRPAGFPEETLSPELTLTRLSNVICLPGQIALHRPAAGEPVLLEEALTSRWDHNAVHLDKINDQSFALRADALEAENLAGSYLYLDNMHSPHFGHFLTDVLSKTWAWDAARELGLRDLKVLVEAQEAPHITALLQACGIPASAIHPVTRPVRCAEVLFAAQSFLIQGWTSPVAIHTWRRIREALDDGLGPEKIYISRAKVKNRRLVNEDEIETVFRARGFYIAHPQELSMRQQITLWANARIIAGSAGSNMFGLAFQRQLTQALVINSPNFLHFQEMFMQAGHAAETSFYFGQALDHEVHGVWRVPAEDLARHVDAWLGQPPPPPVHRQPVAPRRSDYLALFDAAFYLSRHADVRGAIAAGVFANARQHYELSGFREGRSAFAFDDIWYAASYPEVLNEIARGNFADCAHHYAAIGHLAGCLPHANAALAPQPDAAAPGSTSVAGRWWQVDLGFATTITEIRVHVMTAAEPLQTGRFSISVGFDEDSWVEVFRKDDDAPLATPDLFIWKPDLPAWGRLVLVAALASDTLSLDRVEVYGPRHALA